MGWGGGGGGCKMKYQERYIQVEINSVVNDACLQYLHCTDKDQQSKTVRLSVAEIEVYDTIDEFPWSWVAS